MHGKKQSKARITVALACNADGTEREEPLFIGKFAKPCPFKLLPQDPKNWMFKYCSNAKAWMTSVIFEEFVCFPTRK
jgi:hypothetical protein